MTDKKIDDLRSWMTQEKIDAFLVPRADLFQGEYVAPCDERLAWLSGFTGSAGMAIVGSKSAALFVDGRYTLQAPAQVDTDTFEICEIPQYKTSQWLMTELSAGGLVGFDPWLHTLAQIRAYKKAFDLSGIVMKTFASNPIDALWGDRPERGKDPIWHHHIEYAGQSSQEKRAIIKEGLDKTDMSAVLITDPESVSWLFNIRGNDVPNTPLVHAMAWITADGDDLIFVDKDKVSETVRADFDTDVSIASFSDIQKVVKEISELGTMVQIDPKNCPYALYDTLTTCGVSIKEVKDPCLLAKACKNETEVSGARKAHVVDGVAFVKFLHWFESNVADGNLDELTVVEKLHGFRAMNDDFVSNSFDTIAGFGSNGAIIHYRAKEETNLPIKGDGILLLDSGGQYPYGTTDITRTIAVGAPSEEMIDRNTRVLKGMIAASQVRFPSRTRASAIDPHARHALWEVGLDYPHATGHSVGSFLGVHEAVQIIASSSLRPLQTGMILSNEPGYYKAGEYGIRIENLITVVDDSREDEEQDMRAFETLTLAPIDKRLIEESLLTDNEKTWLADYHARVVKELDPHLNEEEKAFLSTFISM